MYIVNPLSVYIYFNIRSMIFWVVMANGLKGA
jgi:hypothetical protein